MATLLGPRPNEAGSDRATWDQAAQAIEAYRSHYQIDGDDRTALGPEPPRAASNSATSETTPPTRSSTLGARSDATSMTAATNQN